MEIYGFEHFILLRTFGERFGQLDKVQNCNIIPDWKHIILPRSRIMCIPLPSCSISVQECIGDLCRKTGAQDLWLWSQPIYQVTQLLVR